MTELELNEKLLCLKKKLENLSNEDLYDYIFDNYNQQLCCKRNLLIRYIINLERDKINNSIQKK